MSTPGQKFRQALIEESPLQIIGTINAYLAMMAQQCGYRAIYLSGAGIANASYGLPDLGLTTLDNVLEDVRRITQATSLPLLVDIDTGWGGPSMVERTIKLMGQAGAAAVHIEDQILHKRCGHRPKKQLISQAEMVEKIAAAVAAKQDPSFVIMARTDALAVEGFDSMVERAQAYTKAGADMIFPEAMHTLLEYATLRQKIDRPILANLTEFGQTPLFSLEVLKQHQVEMVLYPLSVNRVLNFAALQALQTIRREGTQRSLIDKMQTRQELYSFLDYESQENKG